MNTQHPKTGFTMIEMAITLTMVAILAAIAVNMYTSQGYRGRRVDGINSINSIALAEERYRSSNTTYGTLAQVGGSSTSSEAYYTLAVSNVSATNYTITATAQGRQANDTQNGTSCSTLQLSVSSGTVSKTPAACWPS